jgi:hypothetical protein
MKKEFLPQNAKSIMLKSMIEVGYDKELVETVLNFYSDWSVVYAVDYYNLSEKLTLRALDYGFQSLAENF